MNRRSFFNWLMGIAGTALGGAVIYPVIEYLLSPSGTEPEVRSVKAAKADELPPDAYKIFRFGAEPGLLLRIASGEYRAMTAVCTHLGCTVQYRRDHHDIWCACHNGVYDLEGHNVSGPPPRPLERYSVRQVGTDVVVEKSPTS